MAQHDPEAEPFAAHDLERKGGPSDDPYEPRNRGGSRRSSIANVARKLSREFEDSRPPEGFMAATGELASSLVANAAHPPKHSTEKADGSTGDAAPSQTYGAHTKERNAGGVETRPSEAGIRHRPPSDDTTIVVPSNDTATIEYTQPFENGYHFPPKYSWQESTRQGLASFWKFFLTPMGFFWTIYGLNVVAWGGMLFLLLCNAAPAMCYPSCDNIESPKQKWIEWDSQILTGLFCVTAFGLAPWRFRDLWYLLKYRVMGRQEGLRRLAGIHRSWFRLPGSQGLRVDIGPDNIPEDAPRECVPLPEKDMAAAPLTGTRAPPTALWKLDFVIWSMVWNTFAQCGLCGIMWGMNRYNRPSWSTGFLVAIAFIIAIVGGLVTFFEGKKVKRIEGVPCTERDLERLVRDKELGIPHYNNIKDKMPKQKQRDSKK